MRRNPGGRLGEMISPVGYGAWAIGGAFGATDDREAVRSIHQYLDLGGNFIDTARAYGRSEEVIGRAVRTWQGERPLLATKVLSHGPRSRFGRPEPVTTVFPRGATRASVLASLAALGLDSVDLVQFHVYWPTWGTGGYWLDELEDLRREGRCRAIGVSLPDYRHDLGLPLVLGGVVDSVQTVVNLFDPLALDALVPLAAEQRVAVIARGVLDEGGLAGILDRRARFGSDDIRFTFFRAEVRAEYRRRLAELRTFAEDVGMSLLSLAIRSIAYAPGITTAIISMPRVAQVQADMAAADGGPLSEAEQRQAITRFRWVRNFFEPRYREQDVS